MQSAARAVAILLTLGLSAAAPATESLEPDLIPRKLIFGNPQRAAPQISPDGARLAFLAPLNGVMNVWVAPLDDLSAARAVTSDNVRGIRQYFWAYNNSHLIYLQDKGGDENWRVFSVNLQDGQVLDLTPFDGVRAQIQEVSEKHPDELLIGVNQRDPRFHDVYRVNMRTAERTLLQENKRGEGGGFAGFITDESFAVRFALDMKPDGSQELLRADASDWKPFQRIAHEDTLTTSPIGFNKAGDVLYMIDSRGRDTAALGAIRTGDGNAKVMASDPQADIQDVMVHPTTLEIQAVASDYDRVRWQVLDPGVQADFDYLTRLVDADFDVVSRSMDDRVWIVEYSVDNGPVRYYRYDRRDTRKAALLFTTRPDLEDKRLAHMFPVTIPASDGLRLVSYLTLPVGTDPDGVGQPERPLPMVLVVHGGPWARDSWGYNAVHQWLANRGYAVLSVNFRGSTGFGKNFINAGDRQWATRMHADLIDAVDWAIQQRIADPKRVAILGGSYGGYAALVGLTFTPDKFACGVSIVGPSNLITLLESIPPYWAPLVEIFAKRVGDHRTEDGRALLKDRSPLSRVDQIRRPLLIGQGANDPRVKQAESDQIVTAMREKKLPVTYVLYPDEGHGFVRPENSLSFWAVTEAFLQQHLGGRAEPIGDDFNGASITVPTGGEHVPGVPEALRAKE